MAYIGSGTSRFNTADELTVTGDAEFNGNATFGDNDKVIFGAGSDLQVFHDGFNSKIVDAGTGDLLIAADNNITFTNSAITENKAIFTTNGPVTLYHDNAAKFATESTGVSIPAGQSYAIVSDTDVAINRPTTNTLGIKTGNTQRMRIANGGDISFYADNGTTQGLLWDASTQRLGLGTTTPAGLMEVKVASGQSGATQGYRLVTADGGGYALYPTSAVANPTFLHNVNSGESQAFGEGGTAHMTIKSGGSVGIGTASPAVASGTGLQIHNAASGAQTRLSLTNSSTGSASSDGLQLVVENGGGAIIEQREAQYLGFATSASERMRIDGTNLYVGKTSDTSTGTGLTLGGAGFIRAVRNETIGVWNRQGSDGTVFIFARSDSGVGSIDVTTSATTYNTTSDIRLKQDIEPLEATDKLMAMNPVSYNWKVDPDGPRSMGFIAQEMQEVMPEAVSTGDDDMMSMDYGRITPILVSALQDAHRKIEDLESRIAALEAN